MKRLKQIIYFINQHPLAGRHKLKAYYRFFKWQISQFIFPHETIYPFAGNTKLVVKKGLSGATGNIYTGLHEFSDMGFLLHVLRKEDLFFDIGANVGSYTVLASGCMGTRTVTFEPIPSTFIWLQKNININNLTTLVKALQVGVGSSKGILHFTRGYDTENHVLSRDENKKVGDILDVSVVDIDSITFTEGIPVLVKIDVEGFETEVVKGMCESLRSEKLKAIIIELNGSGGRYGFDEELIHIKLLEYNFLPYQYLPFERKLCLLDHYGPFNTIYIRDLDFVKNRLMTADKIKVFSEFV
jgi:FkbM family methyltransferase